MNNTLKSVAFVLPSLLLVLGAAPAAGETAAEFYKGNKISIYVGGGGKGSYAIYARSMQPYLEKHIPGNPDVAIVYMPGAGGAKAANYVYNVAPKDGTAAGFLLKYVAVNQAIGRKGIRYDVRKYGWIGSTAPINSVVAFWHNAPAKTIDGAKKVEVVMGSTGKSSETFITPTLMNVFLGTKFKVVTGYKGLGKVHLALEQGEVDGRSASWQSLRAGKPHWLSENKIRVLAQTGLRKNYDLPEVPRLVDLAPTAEAKAVFEFVGSGSTLGRIFVTPPGVPGERLAALRKGFAAAWADPEFLAIAKKRKFEVEPMTGEQVEAMVLKTVGASPELIAKTKKALGIK